MGGEIVYGQFLDCRMCRWASVTTFRAPFGSGGDEPPSRKDPLDIGSEMAVTAPFPVVEYQPWHQRGGSEEKSSSEGTLSTGRTTKW